MLGTMRSAAQIISYEVPLGLSVLCVCMVCQSLDLQEISYQQSILWQATSIFIWIESWGIETGAIGGFRDMEYFQNATFGWCMDYFFYCFASGM